MSSRTRSRKQASIGSNHSLRRPTPISASEPRTGNFVLLLVMAWSPPAHNAGNVRVSAPGDYATFNSNHTPDGTKVVVQLGGIYALEGVMNTSEQYHQPVLEALCAFVRDGTKTETGDGPPATQIQAALTVIGRRASGIGWENALDLAHI